MSKEKKPEKALDPTEVFLSRLTPAARAAVRATAEPGKPSAVVADEDDFEEFSQQLTPATREVIEGTAALISNDEDIAENVPRFCLVESENGEWPRLRICNNAEALVKQMAAVEGKDMTVFPFYGIPLRFSKGPQRYLILPDGETALSIPVVEGAKIQRVEAELLGLEVEPNNFVGPPELADPDGVEMEGRKKQPNVVPTKPGRHEDEDDEDEEDGDEGEAVED